eukprot:8333225-Alexandrium_andersonii.AAC.1
MARAPRRAGPRQACSQPAHARLAPCRWPRTELQHRGPRPRQAPWCWRPARPQGPRRPAPTPPD